MNAINTGKAWAADHSDGDVKLLFAGGLFGVLAAVNEAVEDSYWTTLFLVMFAVWLFLYATYWTVPSTLILMIPVLMSQFACEAFMYLMHIDLNDEGVKGGEQISYIGGLNWYPNNFVRFMLDGAVTHVFDARNTAAAVRGSSNLIYGGGVRAQVDW